MSVSHEPSTAPARSRAATRERLVAAAVTLFARDGLHGVTSHDIARAAGVAAGTFYLHFRDKQSLFREVVFEAVAELRARLERASDGVTERASAVRARLAALLEFAEERRDVVGVLFGRDHAAAHLQSDVLDFLAQHAEAGLREQIERGAVRGDLEPAVAAQALVGQQARAIAWWIEDPSRASRERMIETLATLQISGTEPK
jgi:AcrR family transcriptional regulator